MMRSLARTVSIVAVLASGLAGAGVVLAATTGTPSHVPAAARSIPESGISQAAIRDMADHHVTITRAEASLRSAKVAAKDAVLRAAGSFGFVNDGNAVGVSLATLTDELYGTELESNFREPSHIAPTLKDELVWLVEFDGFTPFASAPLDTRTSAKTAANGHMLVAVDAVTGDVVWGNQY